VTSLHVALHQVTLYDYFWNTNVIKLPTPSRFNLLKLVTPNQLQQFKSEGSRKYSLALEVEGTPKTAKAIFSANAIGPVDRSNLIRQIFP
jgi:hypothetical protein